MLAAVLLEVVEPPGSINLSIDRIANRKTSRLTRKVKDSAVIFFDHIDDIDLVQRTGIIRLPAAGRVKGCPIEQYFIPALAALDVKNPGLEFQQARVRKV